MDGLDDKQRVEAWKAFFQNSQVGIAIVDNEGRFISVSRQWVKMLGVPATEFYGKRFQDITQISELDEDVEQANLVVEGKINTYEMDKTYEFTMGKKVPVRLLVTRVPFDTMEDFMFHLSTIVLRKSPEKPALNPQKSSTSPLSPKADNTFWAQVVGFVVKYWLAIAVGSAAFVGLVSGLLNEFFQMGFF